MATLGQILGTDTTATENRYIQQMLGTLALQPKAPTLEQINLPQYGIGEQFQYVGDYTQEMATLDQLNQIVSGGGLTDIDRARLAEIRAQQAAQERGGRQAILQGMAQRGLGGGGSELAAYLQAQQSGADRAALEGAQVAAEAQARQLQAGLQRAGLAGNIGERDYTRQAQKAEAQDIINRFNVQNKNLAQMSNLERQQAISNLNKQLAQANVDARQRQEIINKYQIPLSQFELTSQQQGKLISGLQDAAGTRFKSAQQRAQQMRDLIGTGAQAAAAYFGAPVPLPGATPTRGEALLSNIGRDFSNYFTGPSSGITGTVK
jgi:hypothetical protein